jgi:hypothetical protein
LFGNTDVGAGKVVEKAKFLPSSWTFKKIVKVNKLSGF